MWTTLLWSGCFGDEPEGSRPDLELTAPKVIASPGVQPAPALGPDEPPTAMSSSNCGDLPHGGPVGGPDCVTARVQCNDVVYGHTYGGTAAFDTRFYERHKCTPGTTDHSSGDERTYLLEFAGGEHHGTVWLDTPCADLDLAMMRVEDTTSCPTLESAIRVCDMWPKPGTRREKVEFAVQGATKFLIVVEGKGNEEGAFALTIQCEVGLH